MSEKILNRDGSVYMTLPAPVPSAGDLEGWVVRHVTSGTHGPACPHSSLVGTFSLASTDVGSHNELLAIIGSLAALYGYPVRSSRITGRTYRWTWERQEPNGHRASDMIIASKIED